MKKLTSMINSIDMKMRARNVSLKRFKKRDSLDKALCYQI